jgi:hypothetical protein
VVPVLVSPLRFGLGVNVERVIMTPSLDSEASLVRMRSRELSLRASNGIREGDMKKERKAWTDMAMNAQT